MFSITRDSDFQKLLNSNLKKRYQAKKRTKDTIIHVSDIMPQNCMRKSYYNRVLGEDHAVSDVTMFHWLRGEAMERIITELSEIGASQIPLTLDDLIGTPDIMRRIHDGRNDPDSFLVVELKSTASLKRFVPSDSEFKAYLLQLVSYMVMSDIEHGLLVIRYETRPMEWISRDDDGNDHFVRKLDAPYPGLECWTVHLSLEAPERKRLYQELVERRDTLRRALDTNDVSILARLKGRDRLIKCKECPYQDHCWNVDIEAIKENKPDVLDEIASQMN